MKRKLEQAELDLLEVIEDPIYLGEFLRSTADASPQQEEHNPFKYRWYQKDLLTDNNKFIVLTGGRAIGKCSPASSRVYTIEYGYENISKLYSKPYKFFTVYALNDKTNAFEQRRAFVEKQNRRHVYTLRTESGMEFTGTSNHPVQTPNGYVPMDKLNVGDRVAVVTKLPHHHQRSLLSWYEARWLGYIMLSKYVRPEQPIPVQYQKQFIELQLISEYLNTKLVNAGEGFYVLKRRNFFKQHPCRLLLEVVKMFSERGLIGNRWVPKMISTGSLEVIKTFLESLWSAYGVFSNKTAYVEYKQPWILHDLRELMLKFGVETTIKQRDSGMWRLELYDYYSFCRFFTAFNIPGITAEVEDVGLPLQEYRYDSIVSIVLSELPKQTYALQVQEFENYISDNVLVHNSVVVEDKIIWESVNVDLMFPETKEQTLVTANEAQMNPILDRIIQRFNRSRLLKSFLHGNVNRSKGTLEFDIPGAALPYKINARIAGSRGEQNMVS